MSPHNTPFCVFSGLQGPWFVCCFHFDNGLAHALGGISDVAYFLTNNEHL